MKRQRENFRAAYQPPLASWRFYLELPLADTIFDSVSAKNKRGRNNYPYPDFARAWAVSMKNLTLGEMLTTTIALKRYALRHGGLPATLDALAPEFLATLPRDLMDGQLLRYQRRRDGAFCLYSIGEDGRDNQADPGALVKVQGTLSAWDGPDWVWPQLAPSPPATPRVPAVLGVTNTPQVSMRR